MPPPPPLPHRLKHLTSSDAPKRLCSSDVGELLEFWGFTRSGIDFVRKLERCGALNPIVLKHQRGKRWSTAEVLDIWRKEQA